MNIGRKGKTVDPETSSPVSIRVLSGGMPRGWYWNHLRRMKPLHFPAGSTNVPRKKSREMEKTDKLPFIIFYRLFGLFRKITKQILKMKKILSSGQLNIVKKKSNCSLCSGHFHSANNENSKTRCNFKNYNFIDSRQRRKKEREYM